MTEHVELFHRSLCFTPIWGVVDLLLILHFIISWRRSAIKTRWKMDFWYLTLFMMFFPSLFLLYPFNGSIYNNGCTMGFQYRILPYIDMAFFISVLGYISVWIGRYIFDLTRGNFPFILLFQWTRPISRIMEENVKSKVASFYILLSTIVLGTLILAIQFKEGCFFNGRAWFMKEPLLRPVFNLVVSLFPITMTFLTLRFIQFKEKKSLLFFSCLLLFTLFFGVRSLGLSSILAFLLQWIYYRQGNYSFVKLGGACGLLIFLAIAWDFLRQGEYSLTAAVISFGSKLFYGNNFSDTRDFAWILSCWDEEYLLGKSYLAAMISFIPRVFSSIREEWSISMYTNALTGFDSNVMPGLRPGVFGEAFFNFSYPGVVLFGLLLGFAMRFGDLKIKEHIIQSKDLIKGNSYLFIFFFLSCLSVSAGMWAFYVTLFVHLLVNVISRKSRIVYS